MSDPVVLAPIPLPGGTSASTVTLMLAPADAQSLAGVAGGVGGEDKPHFLVSETTGRMEAVAAVTQANDEHQQVMVEHSGVQGGKEQEGQQDEEQEEEGEGEEHPRRRSSQRKPRRDLTLVERRALLSAYDALEGRPSQREAAKRLGVPYSTLHRLVSNRGRLEAASRTLDGGRKRCRTGKNPDVEFAMSQWIGTVSEKNATLSGPMIKRKAEEMAKLMNKPEFRASDGWLSRFKKREGLRLGKPPVELTQVDLKAQEQWIEQVWPSLCARYAAEDIWNADEAAFKFRALPPIGGHSRWGRKGDRNTLPNLNLFCLTVIIISPAPPLTTDDQITSLFCCSMTGDKRPVFVIGEQKDPKCFQKVKHLPVK